MGEVATRHDNLRIPITAKDRIPGDTPYYGANGIQDYVEGYTHEGEFVLVAEDGATDLDNYPVQLISGLSWVNNHAHVIKAIPDVAQNRFIMHLIKSMDIASYLVGGTRSKLNAEVLMGIELKLPSNSEQVYIGALLSTLDSLITLHQRMCSIFCFCAFGSRTNFNQSSKDSFGYYATSVPCRRCARCHRRWLQAPLTSPRRLRFRFFLRWRFDRLVSARKNSIISLMRCRSGSLSSPLRSSVACVSRVLDSGGGARLPHRISGAVGLRANHEEWRRARKSRRQT